MNGRILTDTKFTGAHVVPAAGDDGQCIGAALFAYAHAFRAPGANRSTPLSRWPRGDAVIEEWLDYFGVAAEQLDDARLAERVAAESTQGRMVGLLRGPSEVGPRALCHRSILADPRVAGMKDRLNRLKGRELFRPFAPVVIERTRSNSLNCSRCHPTCSSRRA